MALILDQLTVALGGARVVDRMSVAFAPGRVTAILGPNGAGKSSLLRAMAGLIGASGSATMDGVAITVMPPRERARRIGYLPQQPTVHWSISVAELVALGRMPHRSPFAAPSTADVAAIEAAMAATDVAAFADRTVDTLSGGERARALLARVLAGSPQWLLADEPLASLDPAHQMDLLERLQALAKTGVGVVMVLHDLAHAARFADDVLLMKAGRSLGYGTVSEVMTPDVLRAAFGIEVAMLRDGDRLVPVPVPVGRSQG